MDNRLSIPGYKRYLDHRGDAPLVDVAFLDLHEAPSGGTAVNGVCVPVSPEELAELDARERNYARVEVTARVAGELPGDATIWTYLGLPAARQRAAGARAAGTLVLQRDYRDLVERGFAALGHAELEQYRASTAAPDCADLELTRIDLLPAAT